MSVLSHPLYKLLNTGLTNQIIEYQQTDNHTLLTHNYNLLFQCSLDFYIFDNVITLKTSISHQAIVVRGCPISHELLVI
jgi:hypothetical protein